MLDHRIAVAIGNGPSLRSVPDVFLDSYPTFGGNGIFKRFPPDYYVNVDPDGKKFRAWVDSLNAMTSRKYIHADHASLIDDAIPLHVIHESGFSFEPLATLCPTCPVPTGSDRPPMTVLNSKDVSVIRSLTLVANEPRCHRCHPAGQTLLGVLGVDFSTTPLREARAARIKRTLEWGTATFVRSRRGGRRGAARRLTAATLAS